jgi:DNA-binding NtrC family response regulator
MRDAVREIAHIDGATDFRSARTHLFSKRYDWLVTNIRLDAYNGLHLVHLAETARLPIRSLVYADRRDLVLAREAQQAGAFYESRDRVARALAAYLRGTLPAQDRRNPAVSTRHSAFRGGRRCTDSFAPGTFA